LKRMAGVLVAVALLAVTPARAAPPLPQNDPFYTAPNPIPAVPPGTILRSRAATIAALGVPLPVKAWNVMFASTDVDGNPAAAMATIFLPLTAPATSPRPLVSYQMAEDSDSLACSPSYEMSIGTEKEEPSFMPLLALGWTVVVPDYEGLKSAFTVGLQAGRGVLDGIRAAEKFGPAGLEGARTPVGLWGYSGGGLASAWAAEMAPAYAPELNIVGVSAGGVASDIGAVARYIDGGPASGIELAGAVGMSRAYPQIATLWNAAGRAMAASIGEQCIEQYVANFPLKKLSAYTTVANPLELPWVRAILNANRLGVRKPKAPLFIYHSVADELIPMAGVNALVARYCSEDVTVAYYQDVASEHVSLAVSGAPAAIAYLAARFSGARAPSTCGLPMIPAVVPRVV
jgi:hypothetical protein